ncbi:hypothetical protein EX191_18600 [Vibrio chemaguriensis]|uniref:Uncharacterized protein n=1 Tax=Vibrio chemaguriensis TaxID=2527672 RepID=A0ABX1I2C0_9VIBR|nr:hypothetical protein [Vibrio chemaguriensis]
MVITASGKQIDIVLGESDRKHRLDDGGVLFGITAVDKPTRLG